jgi:hypothetical protein
MSKDKKSITFTFNLILLGKYIYYLKKLDYTKPHKKTHSSRVEYAFKTRGIRV